MVIKWEKTCVAWGQQDRLLENVRRDASLEYWVGGERGGHSRWDASQGR